MKITSRILVGGAAGALAVGLTAPAALAHGDHHHQIPTVRSRPVVVDEGAGTATVTINLRHAATKDLSLDWSTLTRGFKSFRGDFKGRAPRALARDHRRGDNQHRRHHWIGRATAGEDYTASSGTVVIPAGATSATVTVPVIDDTTVERSELFLVRFRATKPATTTPSTTATTRTGHTGGREFKGHLRGHRGNFRHSLTVPVLITDNDSTATPAPTPTPGA